MAKSESMVNASRDGKFTKFPKATWEAMKKSGTYGWKSASNLDDELLEKESEIKAEPKPKKKRTSKKK